MDFVRVISFFGVDFKQSSNKCDWTRFRQLANLGKKSDERLTLYLHDFMQMCWRVLKKKKMKIGGCGGVEGVALMRVDCSNICVIDESPVDLQRLLSAALQWGCDVEVVKLESEVCSTWCSLFMRLELGVKSVFNHYKCTQVVMFLCLPVLLQVIVVMSMHIQQMRYPIFILIYCLKK